MNRLLIYIALFLCFFILHIMGIFENIKIRIILSELFIKFNHKIDNQVKMRYIYGQRS